MDTLQGEEALKYNKCVWRGGEGTEAYWYYTIQNLNLLMVMILCLSWETSKGIGHCRKCME